MADFGKIAALDPRIFYAEYFPGIERQEGPNVMVKCPFHKDDQSSLSVNVEADKLGIFKCFGCGVSGNLVQFYQRYTNTRSIIDAIEEIALEFGLTKEAEVVSISEDTIQRWHGLLLRNERIMGLVRFDRGITELTVQRFQLGWDEQLDRITIPIRDKSGRVV